MASDQQRTTEPEAGNQTLADLDTLAEPAGPDGAGGGGSARVVIVTVAALGVLLLILLGFFAGRVTAEEETTPADLSADAGFARDMQVHHAQAVDMAMTIRDRTTDPEIRTMAYDIALTQEQQIGQLYGWLVQWGLPQTSSRPPMAWAAGMSGHDMAAGRMPGLAATADMRRLATASGRDAERIFLQLMIEHHRGGVQMAEAALDSAEQPEIRDLARKIVVAQESEITAMQDMLRART